METSSLLLSAKELDLRNLVKPVTADVYSAQTETGGIEERGSWNNLQSDFRNNRWLNLEVAGIKFNPTRDDPYPSWANKLELEKMTTDKRTFPQWQDEVARHLMKMENWLKSNPQDTNYTKVAAAFRHIAGEWGNLVLSKLLDTELNDEGAKDNLPQEKLETAVVYLKSFEKGEIVDEIIQKLEPVVQEAGKLSDIKELGKYINTKGAFAAFGGVNLITRLAKDPSGLENIKKLGQRTLGILTKANLECRQEKEE